MKQLSDLSLQELYELFPIVLKEYNPNYPKWYQQEKENLETLLQKHNIILHHIGSTAIKGIISKPIIDILCEIEEGTDIECILKQLKVEWIVMEKTMNPLHVSLNKGYTMNGYDEKVFHLHIVMKGNNEQVHFKDVLNNHEELRKEYETLKKHNLLVAKEDRDLYTALKMDFVNKISRIEK